MALRSTFASLSTSGPDGIAFVFSLRETVMIARRVQVLLRHLRALIGAIFNVMKLELAVNTEL